MPRYLSLPLLAVVVPAIVMAAWFLYRTKRPVLADAWVGAGAPRVEAQQHQLQLMAPEALRTHATNRFKTSVVVCLFLLHNKVSKVGVRDWGRWCGDGWPVPARWWWSSSCFPLPPLPLLPHTHTTCPTPCPD